MILTGLTLIVTCVVLVVFFPIRRRDSKILWYWLHTTRLHHALELPPDLRSEADLSITTVTLWNEDVQTVDRRSMSDSDSIIMIPKDGGKILDARPLCATNTQNRFLCTILQDGSRASVAFDHMGKNEGAVFQIIHSGNGEGVIKLAANKEGVGRLTDFQLTYAHHLAKCMRFAGALFVATILVLPWLVSHVPILTAHILTLLPTGLMLLIAIKFKCLCTARMPRHFAVLLATQDDASNSTNQL